MTTQDKIKKIVEECMKANPSKKWGYTSTCCGVYITENPQLADVLLMIRGKHIGIQSNGCFIDLVPGEPGKYDLSQRWYGFGGWYETNKWDLTKPLHLQSPETIDFVYGLIK